VIWIPTSGRALLYVARRERVRRASRMLSEDSDFWMIRIARSARFAVKWLASNAGKRFPCSLASGSCEVSKSLASRKTVSNLRNRVSPLGVQL